MISNGKKGRRLLLPLLSASVTYLVFAILCRVLHILPFSAKGPNTLAWADAFYQYLDFFGWYKEILAGRQSIWYTFSSSLGQNASGLFSYYLASPFNLLLFFFPKTKLQAFFNVTAGLKMAACSCTMAIFLQERFQKLAPFFILLLSLCCGLMQYNFSQSSNLMWIDGVYMLPLILLGVYWLVHRKKTTALCTSVALSVIFNWYTGGINCLAAVMYFPVELCLKNDRGHDDGMPDASGFLGMRACGRDILRFLLAMATGLALSAFLFLPTVFAMRTGRGSALDWSLIRNELLGSPSSLLRGYFPGEISVEGYAALFCGSVPLLSAAGFFTLRGHRIREKIAFALLLALAALSFFWRPLFMVFSLLKEAGSYWYRYAYIAQIFLIIAAAHTLQEIRKIRTSAFAAISAILLLLAVRADRITPHENRTLFAAGMLLAFSAFLLLLAANILSQRASFSQKASPSQGVSRHLPNILVAGLLLPVTIAELSLNGYSVAQNYLRDDAPACEEYNECQEKLIRLIKEQDEGVYRITQNMTRSMDYHWTTANLNESMGLGYMAVENYTSCPQNTQLNLLDRFGYAVYSDRILPKSTFLQPVDSLLGVRYLLSPYEVREVETAGPAEPLNGKQIYRNDYALPFAFRTKALAQSPFVTDAGQKAETASLAETSSLPPTGLSSNPVPEKAETGKTGSVAKTDAAAPFEYWNDVYCALTGSDEKIMEELDYSRRKSDGEILYTIQVPDQSYAVYGNITHRKDANAYLRLNDRFNIPYAKWQAVQAFNIPSDPGQHSVTVNYKAKNLHRIVDVRFYGLNLKVFKKYTDLLKKGSPSSLAVSKGKVDIKTDGKTGELLFTSIPYDDGWSITLNGNKIEPQLFENCLICLPLQDGQNTIRMRYTPPGLYAGIALSILGAVLYGLLRCREA